jgi:hypothetical protein
LVWVLIGLVTFLGWQNYNYGKRATASLHQQLYNANFLIVSAEVNLGLALTSQTPDVHLEKAAAFLARATPVLQGAALLDRRYGDVWDLSQEGVSVAEALMQEVWFDLLKEPSLESNHNEQIAETRAFLTKLSAALPKWGETELSLNKWLIEAARDTTEEYIWQYKTIDPGGT